MFPRPLHRWKSIWLGILVLALLGFGWVRSMSWTDGFFWFPEHFALTAYQSAGQIGFSWDQSRLRTSVMMFNWVHEPISSAGESWFPKAVVPEVYDRQFQFGIAHWFLMLLFLIAWAAFLFWRIQSARSVKSSTGLTIIQPSRNRLLDLPNRRPQADSHSRNEEGGK